jgi:hypothetical protein
VVHSATYAPRRLCSVRLRLAPLELGIEGVEICGSDLPDPGLRTGAQRRGRDTPTRFRRAFVVAFGVLGIRTWCIHNSRMRIKPLPQVVLAGALLVLSPLLTATQSAAAPHRASTPGHFDTRSNGGKGVALAAPVSGEMSLFVVNLSDGVTVVGYQLSDYASNYMAQQPLVLKAVTAHCKIDASFGTSGRVVVRLPPVGGTIDFSSVGALLATRHGDLLVLGNTGHSIFALELGPTGRPVESFGDRGWARLQYGGGNFPPEVRTAALEPDGTILIGADAQPLCCLHSTIFALAPTGHLDRSFGRGGHVFVLGAGAFIQQLIPGPPGTRRRSWAATAPCSAGRW